MKTIKYLLMSLFVAFAFSCNDFLDPEADGTLTEKDIFTNWERARGFLNNIYNYIPGGFYSVSDAMLACATDEAKNVSPASEIVKMTDGTMNSKSFAESSTWTHYYTAIRKTTVFLENVDEAVFVSSQVSAVDPEANDRMRKQYKGEAYFLRGLFYFELIKRFGGVPLLPETRLGFDDDLASIPRSSYEECVNYIVECCTKAEGLLPNSWNNNTVNYGRATKGAIYALKSRTLLYAASKLNNVSNDLEKWKAAAAAAKVVLDMPEYDLLSSDDPKWNNMLQIWTEPYNKEVLFATSASVNNTIESREFPYGLSYYNAQGGAGNTNPTHDFVKAFQMADGSDAVWPTEGGAAPAADLYKDRDPRLAYFIAYNGSIQHKNIPDLLATGVGQESGIEKSPASTKTGYYLRKFVNAGANIKEDGDKLSKYWIIFRYAEILLNYAEAMNEAYGPTETPAGYSLSALDALNLVRNRVKMPDYESNRTVNQANVCEGIRHERRIELCFEEHRFYDVRRWDTGVEIFNKPVYGIRITGNAQQIDSWREFKIEDRKFSEKMNLYPIPYSEILKTKMEQNPGWD